MDPSTASIRLNVNAAIVRDHKILAIEFEDENGIHYNLPGGGVDPGESLTEALRRECREEASIEVEVGRLLLIWEYVPALHGNAYGPRPKVGHVFDCRLAPDAPAPRLPHAPDKNQRGVKWVSLADLADLADGDATIRPRVPPLFPKLGAQLREALVDPARPIHPIGDA